ncbi:MAG: hypothetical protein ACRDSR_13310 [Pseudonocardiaceae bacterium]
MSHSWAGEVIEAPIRKCCRSMGPASVTACIARNVRAAVQDV